MNVIETFDQRLIRGRYRLVQLIATGGLGHVYYGWDEQLERVVAIKRLKRDASELGQNLESALKEAKTLAALQHPNVVTLFDYGVDEEGAFYVLEFIEGKTLDHHVEKHGVLDEENFLDIARQALEGVNAAHKCGIIHRDLKPSNVMLKNSPSGGLHVKVLDFGLAKFQETPSPQTMDESHSIMGSIYYASPEQFQGLPVDERSDLYSLGHLFYTSLVGYPAFNGATIYETIMLHLQTEPPALSKLRPDLDPFVCDWVHSLMARDPDLRPASSAQALHALISWQRLLTQPKFAASSVIPPISQKVASASSKKLWMGLTAAVVLILGGVGFWMKQSATTEIAQTDLKASALPSQLTPEALPVAVQTLAPPASSTPPSTAPEPSPIPEIAKTDPVEVLPSAPAAESALEYESPFDPSNLSLVQKNVGKTVSVKGKIVDFGENKKGTIYYLNFSKNYRGSLALVFFIGTRSEEFTKENLTKFLEKDVQAKGRIQEYQGGYQMVVDSLADLREIAD